MSISNVMPAQPEDESKKQQEGSVADAVDVLDIGVEGASALFSGGPSVPRVSPVMPEAVTTASDAIATAVTAAADTTAAAAEAGLSVGDIADGVLGVIGGIFDAS